jgi:hypothetical protein
VTRWYLAFAAFAAALAVASGQPIERCWGTWAAIGYATAAAITAAAPRRRGRHAPAVALGCAAGCGTVAPLAWQAFAGLPSRSGEGSLTVIAQAGGQLLRHGTPYLPAAGLTHVLAYDPYEPLMAGFGLPDAAGLTGWPASPRLWLVLAGAAGVYLAFRIPGAPPRRALRSTALALASPVLALPLATGGTDLPVIAALCVALALAERAPRRAALAAGVACGLKAIAWPAVPVIAALLTAARGTRVGWRFTTTAAVTAVAAMAVTAPAALSPPRRHGPERDPVPARPHEPPQSCREPAARAPARHRRPRGEVGGARRAGGGRRRVRLVAGAPPAAHRPIGGGPAGGRAHRRGHARARRSLGLLRLSAGAARLAQAFRPAGRRSYSSERALATPLASAVASSGGTSTGADAVPASG